MRFGSLFLLAPLALAGCVATTEPAAEAPQDNPQAVSPAYPTLSSAEREACMAKGGMVEQRGRMQAELCVVPYADAGKACTDGDQCEGKCIAEGAVGTPPGETTTGICQRDDKLFGCFGEVENGRIENGICVD